jgi:peptidyl-prolyl cis-trans isomerase SurA
LYDETLHRTLYVMRHVETRAFRVARLGIDASGSVCRDSHSTSKRSLPRATLATLLRSLLVGGVLLCAACASRPGTTAGNAPATIPLTLSELEGRARPFLQRIDQSPLESRATKAADIYRQLMIRMVDERLVEQAANQAHLAVTQDEVDRAVATIAVANHETSTALLYDVRGARVTEQEYRDEIRRQVLETKVLQHYLGDRLQITESDARTAYATWLKARDPQVDVDVRILVMHLPSTSEATTIQRREHAARALIIRVQSGEDFCEMVRQYSDDHRTVGTCGSRGLLPVTNLSPEVRRAVETLKPGDVTDPILDASSTTDPSILVVQLVSRQARPTPTYEDVRLEMMDRALDDVVRRERDNWLVARRCGVEVHIVHDLQPRDNTRAGRFDYSADTLSKIDESDVLRLLHPAL